MKTIAIMQPTYLPWLGYFQLIKSVDTFVFLDNVQFGRGWQYRNRLKGSNNEPYWLSVPLKKHSRNTPLNEIEISLDQFNWTIKHMNSIKRSLGKSPFFSEIYSIAEKILTHKNNKLSELNIYGIRLLCQLLDLKTDFILASDLSLSGTKGEYILNICRKLNVDCYLSPVGSSVYLDEQKPLFFKNEIKIEYQDWKHPVYKQTGNGKFISHLSVLDPIAELGVDIIKESI